MQEKHTQWVYQWKNLEDNSVFLFKEWINPYTLEDFRDKTVLDCGCGSGQHLSFIAPYAREVIGVDLNTSDVAREKNKNSKNVKLMEGDIATLDLNRSFDIVYSIGVLHHTDSPEKSFKNIKRMLKQDGLMIIWVYSHEGNFLNRTVLEFIKRIFIRKLGRNLVLFLAKIITVMLYVPIYTVYLLPLKFLPFYEYFENFRKLSFDRNLLNVFDKLNAPQTFFIKESDLKEWFNPGEFRDILIKSYKGVSWHASGRRK